MQDRVRNSAAARLDRGEIGAGDRAQEIERRIERAERILVAMAVDRKGFRRGRIPGRRDTSRGDLRGEVFVREPGMAREKVDITQAAQEHPVLIAKGEQA